MFFLKDPLYGYFSAVAGQVSENKFDLQLTLSCMANLVPFFFWEFSNDSLKWGFSFRIINKIIETFVFCFRFDTIKGY